MMINDPQLFIVPTPIGNMEDITIRAIETLKKSDLILAEDTRHAKKLLNEYLIRRDQCKHLLFTKSVEQMDTIKGIDHYEIATSLLKRLDNCENFNSVIGVTSFCQTWATEDSVGEPQFSVASPHFQTRFFIKNLPIGVSPTEIEAYKQVIREHDESMAEYAGKFVNLDGLSEELNK